MRRDRAEIGRNYFGCRARERLVSAAGVQIGADMVIFENVTTRAPRNNATSASARVAGVTMV